MKRKFKVMRAEKVRALNEAAVPIADDDGLQDGLHLKGAEFWLMLGEPTEALAELEAISSGVCESRSLLKVRVAAMRQAKLA